MNPSTLPSPVQPEPSPQRGRAWVVILVLGAASIAGTWFFRQPLRSRILERGTLANEAPSIEAVQDVIETASDPQTTLLAFWNTGKIVHRQLAISELHRIVPLSSPMPSKLESLVTSAALDPDLDVRELAFGILRERNHSGLAALAAAQLLDLDPETRILGLEHLKSCPANIGIPLVLPVLDDPDPRVAVFGLKRLEHWTGQTFGVKLADTAEIEDEQTGLKGFSELSLARAKAGAVRAKAWWSEHKTNFVPAKLELPASASGPPLRASEFQLTSLEGRQVHLSEFRGKVVLLNFWTTWCPACLSEMPELVALQKRHHEDLAILGISLDYVPDEHGDIGGA